MSALAPNDEQRLLLRAACGERDVARAAWDRWRTAVDLDQVDRPSFRLLPQVYRHLLALGVDDPVLERLKGVYRFSWSANAAILGATREVVDRMAAAEVPALLVEGVALAAVYYRDHGARLVDSLALLVPQDRVVDAGRELIALGWRGTHDPERGALPAHLTHTRFVAPKKPVDICWDLLPLGTAPRVAAAVMAGAQRVGILGTVALTIAPADQLLQVCVRAGRWDDPAPWRRLADAMIILREVEWQMDWDRLVDLSQEARVVLPVLGSLRSLVAVFDAPVPAAVLTRLERSPVSRRERTEQRWQELPPTRLGLLPALLFRYWRMPGNRDRGREPMEFARYLQQAWGLPRVRDVPAAVVRKGIRRALSRGSLGAY